VRIGVISDTHGLVRPEVFDAFAGVDHILHAGDIGGEEILLELRALAPLTACAGNIDGFSCGDASETARVTLEGVRFYLTHILDRPNAVRAAVRRDLDSSPADVVVFGHSHLPHDEEIGGVRYFNPASAGPRRFAFPVSVGIIEVEPGRVPRFRHVPLDARSKFALAAHMNQLTRP
jgi:putative phosphoesterase